MMCSYKTCFSYSHSPSKNTRKERGNFDQDLILGKLHFPKELTPFFIISTIIFNKIHHQKCCSDLWGAETHSKLWMREHIIWQRGRGHKATSVRRRHEASGDVKGATCKQWHLAPMCRYHRHCHPWHTYAKSETTLSFGLQLPFVVQILQSKRNATVWKGYSWTRITGTAAFLHIQNFKTTLIVQ